MPNIDPLYFAVPLSVLALSAGLVLYWAVRRRLAATALVYSLLAYAGAIALKYAVQIPTASSFEAATGGSLVALGAYYGAQTAAFEVGGAFLVSLYAVRRGALKGKDAEGYGLGLAFWENGVIFAIPLLLDYLVYYVLLSSPSSSSQSLYNTLAKNAPALFYGAGGALPLIGYSILERVSSLMAHLSWGVLCVAASVTKRRSYFVAALPLGFATDFFVPITGRLGIALFEVATFVMSAAWLAMTLRATRSIRGVAKTGA